MQKNIGVFDRFARVVVGLAIVYFAVQAESLWGFVGVALLVTATFEYCFLYKIFGIRTCKTRTLKSDKKECCKK